jgi:hypothetical protein
MMAATAKINAHGTRWDPEKGWIGPDGQEIFMTADLAKERANLERVNELADSDTQDFGTIEAVPTMPAKDEDYHKPSVEELDAIADINQDSGHQFLSEDEDQVTDEDLEGTSRSLDTRSVGRYIQIEDTGSIQSHYRNPANKKQSQFGSTGQDVIAEDDIVDLARNASIVPSPGTKGMFPRMEETNGEGNVMHIQKEELDHLEVGLFGADQGAKAQRQSGPVDLDALDEEEEMSAALDDSPLSEAEPSQEEIFEQETNDSFGEATDFSWDEDDAQDQELSIHKPVPRLKINIRGSTGSEVSFGSLSTSSRSIPKLRGPRRDSSPIHGGRLSVTNSMHATQPRRESDMLVSTLSPRSSPEISSSADEDDNLLHITEEHRQDPPIEPLGQLVTPDKDDTNETSERDFVGQQDPPKDPIVEQKRSVSVRPIVSRPSEDSEHTSVKSLHEYWEARSATTTLTALLLG